MNLFELMEWKTPMHSGKNRFLKDDVTISKISVKNQNCKPQFNITFRNHTAELVLNGHDRIAYGTLMSKVIGFRGLDESGWRFQKTTADDGATRYVSITPKTDDDCLFFSKMVGSHKLQKSEVDGVYYVELKEDQK